jgi:hypothetical protein
VRSLVQIQSPRYHQLARNTKTDREEPGRRPGKKRETPRTPPGTDGGLEAAASSVLVRRSERIRTIERVLRAPSARISLKPYEAAFVLRSSEAEVRRQLRRGELTPSWQGRRLCVAVRELAQRAEDDLLALEVLAALAEDWFVAPRNFSPKLPAPPLSVGVTQLREHLLSPAFSSGGAM